MTPTPKGWRGLFIACLIAHEIGKRLRTSEIVAWIDAEHPDAVSWKVKRSKRRPLPTREEAKEHLAGEIDTHFKRSWGRLYPATRRERDGGGEWCYYRVAPLTLRSEEFGTPSWHGQSEQESQGATSHHGQLPNTTERPPVWGMRDRFFACLRSHPMGREQGVSALEAANWIAKHYPEEVEAKRLRTQERQGSHHSLAETILQLRSEIGSNFQAWHGTFPNLQRVMRAGGGANGGPGRDVWHYFLAEEGATPPTPGPRPAASTMRNPAPVAPLPPAREPPRDEAALYPLVSAFLKSRFAVYAWRIDERKSGNSQGKHGNRWLFPDLVGMENLSAEWAEDVKECVKQHGDKKTKLWSLEVKKELHRSNVRESFFQAVSNSAWANLGYLVASRIAADEGVHKELRILASLHGIGVIRFDASEPANSQILIPAREKTEVDWDAANRLAKENSDFLAYIRKVRNFYLTGDI